MVVTLFFIVAFAVHFAAFQVGMLIMLGFCSLQLAFYRLANAFFRLARI